MMFACCHPGISEESQIALVLKTLCGFSVREIASAFLTNEAAIEKRLGRARKYFREHHVEFEVPSREAFQERIHTVLKCLYLLFNEGYKRTDSEGLVNRELCLEALRLAILLAEHPEAESPEALALVSLMTFHAARFNARTDDNGEIVLLSEQDRSRWDSKLIATGMQYLERSRPDLHASSYHLEAAIQSVHAVAPSYARTDWPVILGLYKRLFGLAPSNIVALHMAVPVCKVHGPQPAIDLLRAHPLPEYYLYHAVLGDCFEQSGKWAEAREAFATAIDLTRNDRERALLGLRLTALGAD
jgi:predicted RNA polymerase sigma factor